MEKFVILFSIILLSFASIAQVSVNTDGSDADPSAMLDVMSTDKGLLIPRVLFANRPINPTNGLLIYQTDIVPGYYYYNGNEWNKMVDFNQADWDEVYSAAASYIKNKPENVSEFFNDAGYLDAEVDGDTTNELQVVAKQDYEVTLSQDGGTFMTGLISYTQAEIDALTPYNGLTVYNVTTNCINYYYMNNWFETCGTCTPMPTQAVAGDTQVFLDNTIATTLEGNTPEQGEGLWTVASGTGGSFDDPPNPTSQFTGEICTDYTLVWAISNSCGSTTDSVDISFFGTSTIAFAGKDTIVKGGDTTLVLTANTPEVGNGLWSVLKGEGGTFANAGNATSLFIGLPDVHYTLQWKITTICDTTYDEVAIRFYPWQCGSLFTDIRDGQTYETVQIGGQCWMAENLNIGTMINGSDNQTDDEVFEKYCYKNKTSNCDTYGGLYQWNEMMQYDTTLGIQGICPAGWHLPTDAEWCILEREVDTNISCSNIGWRGVNGGRKLKQGGDRSFKVVLAGTRDIDGKFYSCRKTTIFWSSSASPPNENCTSAWERYLDESHATVYRHYLGKGLGLSVRCIEDY